MCLAKSEAHEPVAVGLKVCRVLWGHLGFGIYRQPAPPFPNLGCKGVEDFRMGSHVCEKQLLAEKVLGPGGHPLCLFFIRRGLGSGNR